MHIKVKKKRLPRKTVLFQFNLPILSFHKKNALFYFRIIRQSNFQGLPFFGFNKTIFLL